LAISPIVVNDNVIDLTITPGTEGAAPQLSVSPQTAYPRIDSQLKTAAAASKPVLRRLRDTREPDGSRSVTLTGSVPAGPAIFRAYRVPEPSRFAQLAFIERLKEAGVGIAPTLEAAAPAARYEPEFQVAEHVSLSFLRNSAELARLFSHPPLMGNGQPDPLLQQFVSLTSAQPFTVGVSSLNANLGGSPVTTAAYAFPQGQ